MTTYATPETRQKRRFLSAVFNIAVGAGATALAKTAVVGAMITCPPLAILLASSFAVGTTMTLLCHEGRRRAESKNFFFSKQNLKSVFSKTNAKVFAKSTFYSLVGGALFLGFQEGVIQDAFKGIFGSTPAPAAPAFVPTPCPTPMEQITGVVFNGNVSDRVYDAMNRMYSSNPRVAAQAVKDLAFFSFNGIDGVPKDPTLAKQLFEQAADKGNWQAIRDIKYVSHFKIPAPIPCP